VAPGVVVSLAGVCDLAAAARLGLSGAAAAELLGGLPEDRPQEYAQADPMASPLLGVAQLIAHGTADRDVPYEFSARYAAAAGSKARLLTLPGADHFELLDPATRAWTRVISELTPLLPPGRPADGGTGGAWRVT
jgi:pimeloyl-ACP methyl ester carboxylesterase